MLKNLEMLKNIKYLLSDLQSHLSGENNKALEKCFEGLNLDPEGITETLNNLTAIPEWEIISEDDITFDPNDSWDSSDWTEKKAQ